MSTRVVAMAALACSAVALGVALLALRRQQQQQQQAARASRAGVVFPKAILLIRHAQSAGNTSEDVYATVPDHRVPLTQEGREQAAELGDRLRAKLAGAKVWVYCSPYERVRETCRLALSKLDREQIVYIREDPRLREQEFAGGFQMAERVKTERVSRDKYSKFFFRWTNGESAADVYDRVSTVLHSIFRDFKSRKYVSYMGEDGGVLLIFSHGLTSRLFIMRWLHWPVEQFDNTWNPPNCGILELRRDVGKDGRMVFCPTEETLDILHTPTPGLGSYFFAQPTQENNTLVGGDEEVKDKMWFRELGCQCDNPVDEASRPVSAASSQSSTSSMGTAAQEWLNRKLDSARKSMSRVGSNHAAAAAAEVHTRADSVDSFMEDDYKARGGGGRT